MGEAKSAPPSITRLILIPSILTLGVTLLRLVGERSRWSADWFSTAPGGPGPLAVLLALLAPVFGIYFGLQLARSGYGPAEAKQVVGLGFLGLMLLLLGFSISFLLDVQFTGKLLSGYIVVAFAAGLQIPSWPRLAKTLFAYGLAVRVPIVIVMLLALQGHWGTHFDNVQAKYAHMSFGPMIFYFALLPQLIFWVAFTMVTGAFVGGIAAAFVDQASTQPVP